MVVMDEVTAKKLVEGQEGKRFKAIAVNTILVTLLFLVVYCMLKPKCKAGEECVHPGLPGGTVFDLLEVLVCGILGGKLVANVGLPPLFGQLLMGFLLKNVIPDQLNGLSAGLNSMLRSVALAMPRKSSISTMVLATGP